MYIDREKDLYVGNGDFDYPLEPGDGVEIYIAPRKWIPVRYVSHSVDSRDPSEGSVVFEVTPVEGFHSVQITLPTWLQCRRPKKPAKSAIVD